MAELTTKTIIRDKDGKFWELTEYARKVEQIGENGKEVLGGIDWEKTKELMTEITDEATIEELKKAEKAGTMKIKNGDPEFFAAGTAELASEK